MTTRWTCFKIMGLPQFTDLWIRTGDPLNDRWLNVQYEGFAIVDIPAPDYGAFFQVRLSGGKQYLVDIGTGGARELTVDLRILSAMEDYTPADLVRTNDYVRACRYLGTDATAWLDVEDEPAREAVVVPPEKEPPPATPRNFRKLRVT